MKTPTLALLSSAVVLTACKPAGPAGSANEFHAADPERIEVAIARADDVVVSGPYSFKNLDFYLIHGSDRAADLEVITLAEAMETGDVVVHETGQVNELKISNRSSAKHVFIHSGDIVKGGKQDRTLPNSLVLAPGSKPIPVDSFCVEQSRWAQRGGEQFSYFSASSKSLNTKDLKLAARLEKSQGEVWKKVGESQEKLSLNVYQDQDRSVNSGVSATSLQLALENKDLEAETQAYVEAIEKAAGSREDAIGYAFAVNGEFNSSDVYLTRGLFRKLWAKRLEAAVHEAIGEANAAAEFVRLPSPRILEALRQTNETVASTEKLAGMNHVRIRDSGKAVRFDACYQQGDNAVVVHESVIAK